ncbi:regulation of budding-related protein [Trichosporon asahii var. asahii CBS 2479]|uniref:Regulation of budding-related protein n=1 Tax=Trichosporon asahii var. asahii (strain ATCC 90039 / CBS 2479 / JCM 2466 / KCTC 7840 / NBRC 103889/ NCYC 2677 / UAMH 7654) TaxID=1186058 RepID=J4UE17_TRIAS|nr:regulation of budding-related protein [Trichosporon asahii var. asahii CBS 2479]EJT49450.1 regulation of budding-related protein [Trichosporon asahii var. asahii CBS 2479]
MRESNYTFPPSNRAVISINQMLYDRRALDTNSTLALLNNLCQLTYLSSTSPRIREVLTMDGGLERLLDILRDSCLPREPTMPDLWGLNGPCTARTINVDHAISLRHSLAFQCVVNIGVRGNEAIRSRVVQAGALDIVAQILESWLKKNGIAIHSSSLGSQAAVDALAAGVPLPGTASRRHRPSGSSRSHHHRDRGDRDQRDQQQASASQAPSQPQSQSQAQPQPQSPHPPAATANAHAYPPGAAPPPNTLLSAAHATATANAAGQPNSRGLQYVANLITNRLNPRQQPAEQVTVTRAPVTTNSVDTDVDMADGETEGGETDTAGDTDTGADISMDIEDSGAPSPDRDATIGPAAGTTTTPRPRLPLLPLQIGRRSPDQPQGTSNATSLSEDEPTTAIPRARSDNSLAMSNAQAAAETGRPTSGMASRLHQVATEAVSTQSSPMGSPTHHEHVEGMRGRRGTIVGRPLLLPPREQQPRTDDSEISDAAPDPDLARTTLSAGFAAAAANAAMEAATAVQNQPDNAPQPAIVEQAGTNEEPDPEILAAEQARFDMEAGAPPGQPGAAAQTPRVTPNDGPLQNTTVAELIAQPVQAQPAQIIIANGAPRGFQDLGAYVGVSLLLNPEGTNYSEDNILLALQLLAYLSKYPHVRSTFHHPRRPMHRTFDLGPDDTDYPLPQRPAYSETPNIFSLVERFTFRASPRTLTCTRSPATSTTGPVSSCATHAARTTPAAVSASAPTCRAADGKCSRESLPSVAGAGRPSTAPKSARAKPGARDTVSGTERGSRGGEGRGGGGGGGGSRRDPPPADDDDDDVDMDGGALSGGSRRDPPPADDDDDDVDMDGGANGGAGARAAGSGTTQAAPTPLPTARGVTHLAGPPPAGAAAPVMPQRTAPLFAPSVDRPPNPTVTISPPPSASAASTSSETTPTRETTRRPSPDRSDDGVPSFLKSGREAGPSSTAEMNAAMLRRR